MIKIENIRQSFIDEAKVAPTLFADLAKVELYIAESYRARAFIELLQNADDAGAKDFIIQLHEDKLIVANNGRTFTSDDIQALCRSGSSNKQRGTGTVGYRGIGFKSVAGIATEIDVISGEYHFRFSKSITKSELSSNQDIPLIRIPHPLAKTDASVAIAKELIDQEAISTVFIMSGLDLRILSSEAESFEESALLFLNNIRQVKIDLPGISKLFKRSATLRNDGYTLESIGDNGKDNSWLIVGVADGCEKIAFRIRDELIIPTEKEQAVIHAFLPTTEFSGALLKINGDFSTDPSRKSIDMDSLSVATFKRCSYLLADLIRQALKDKTLHGIFSTFCIDTPTEGRFRKYLREALLASFEITGLSLAGLQSVNPVDICLPPEWLNYADYEVLCRDLPHVPHLIMTIHPDVIAFFKWLGARPLNVEDALKFSKERNLSVLGCAQLLATNLRRDIQ
ncbi:MAG: ATP-binding protein [Methylobacter sp.]|nr:ATP-binding protein [Methylobacter sp.]MDP2427834.1 ATP-binding protein [Methylobacter sp.]MDP3055288.1 ATP-binding protein [Methylobacter sp.]MDP3362436.1 ATP-binding protein [Methylobacter sp.]